VSVAVEWVIPPSVEHWMRSVPAGAPVIVLMRHSVRGHLPPGAEGDTVPITEVGVRLAEDLGRRMGARLASLHSSPILRCMQTAEALRDGAASKTLVHIDRLLGDPGVYVHDPEIAGRLWIEMGHERVMAHLVSKDTALPGIASPQHAARYLVHHLFATAGNVPGLHVFVTHDSIVTATAAQLLGVPLDVTDWPWYLEAALFWKQDGELLVAYRVRQQACAAAALCRLDEGYVIELARRELTPIVGSGHVSRFFLAGGAFKSLLTGRAPRDLDVWAPTPEDRDALVDSLRRRGAEQLDSKPFGDAFCLCDRVVELPFKTEPPTLEERLARFDIGLSAVGAEHLGQGQWRAVIHPLALESVRRREVLLLKPLVNWRHALATLERMRRYSAELGYRIPPEETAAVWKVFDAQDPAMQQGMLQRFDLSTRGGFRVREEAICRLR